MRVHSERHKTIWSTVIAAFSCRTITLPKKAWWPLSLNQLIKCTTRNTTATNYTLSHLHKADFISLIDFINAPECGISVVFTLSQDVIEKKNRSIPNDELKIGGDCFFVPTNMWRFTQLSTSGFKKNAECKHNKLQFSVKVISALKTTQYSI